MMTNIIREYLQGWQDHKSQAVRSPCHEGCVRHVAPDGGAAVTLSGPGLVIAGRLKKVTGATAAELSLFTVDFLFRLWSLIFGELPEPWPSTTPAPMICLRKSWRPSFVSILWPHRPPWRQAASRDMAREVLCLCMWQRLLRALSATTLTED